ncbi:MAG: pyridoxal phosphate-dependent aminotransferase [Gammaproteobacteria bacterium]|nr:pyridoxal phosphate-dependent aminotransferase [Gammaproteobacteria bacterium]
MNIILSEKVEAVKPSPTLAVSNRATELKASGKDIIDLGLGEPDFDTPDHIKEAAIKAIHDGFTKYTAVDGIPSLKKAIVSKFARENNLQYSLNQILVSNGAKQSLYNLFQALLNKGDEVIISAPYWVSYPDMALLADATPVIIYTDIQDGFKISPEQLDKAITPKTRLFVLNSPSNPTGVAYSSDELIALGDVLMKHPHVMIVTDDIYEHILWRDEPFSNIINVCPQLYDRTIVVNGVSKAYAMTGWRIGYAAGATPIINAMKKIQSQSTSNPNSIAQVAAQAALEGDTRELIKMVSAFKERHDYVVQSLNSMEGFECLPADGTFYAFPCAIKLMEQLGLNSDIELADFLLNEAEVAVVPGSAFGCPGYLRLSYATSLHSLHKAMDRIEQAVKAKVSS